jgi:hypothetical protein
MLAKITLKELAPHDLENGNFQLLFESAEVVLCKRKFVLLVTLIEFFARITNSLSLSLSLSLSIYNLGTM